MVFDPLELGYSGGPGLIKCRDLLEDYMVFGIKHSILPFSLKIFTGVLL